MSEQKPTLILLWTYVEWGGAQIYLLAIMKVAKETFDIVVILPRNSKRDILGYLEKHDIRYEFIDACIDPNPARSIAQKLRRQWRRIHAEISSFRYLRKYDLRNSILHIETAPWQSWILLTALAIRRAHVFVTMHNIMPRSSSWREFVWKLRLRFVSKLPRFHIFPSNKHTKNMLKGWVSEPFFEEMEVTYTAVDPVEISNVRNSDIDTADLKLKHEIDPTKFVVLCVGQFIDRKGRWVFLEAASQIYSSNRDLAFVWLTPSYPNTEESQRIEEYGLGDSFKLILSSDVGSHRHDVLSFFRIADIFVLPSFVEGLPIALLEAMALGVPSISTNVNAIPEAVIHEKTGLLVEPGDALALANSITLMRDDADLRVALADAGQTFVLEHFDERLVAQKVIAAYKNSLAGH